MNCQDVLSRLDDYVDGLLPEREWRQVEQHVENCESCLREEQHLRKLLADAGELPREIAPARDLWPGIESRLEERGVRRSANKRFDLRSFLSNRSLLAAAAVIVAIVATSVVTTIINNRRPEPLPRDGQLPSTFLPASSISADYRSADLEYQKASQNLLAMLNERRETLSPETLAVLDENRRIIDEAIREIREALEKDPGSARLNELLLAACKRDLDLLRQAAELPVSM